MRIAISILLLLSAILIHISGIAQPCVQDTAIISIYNTDTLRDDTIQCYPYKCSVTHGGGWQLPPNFMGVADVGGEPLDEYEVIVLNSCDTARIDTCVILSEQLSFRLQLDYHFGANAQIVVYGDSGSVISLQIFPGVSPGPLPSPFLELDTLCGAVAIQPPIPCQDLQYIDIYQYRPVSGPKSQLPPGLYWEWCGYVENGRKISVFR
jgi:hypothetical protein